MRGLSLPVKLVQHRRIFLQQHSRLPSVPPFSSSVGGTLFDPLIVDTLLAENSPSRPAPAGGRGAGGGLGGAGGLSGTGGAGGKKRSQTVPELDFVGCSMDPSLAHALLDRCLEGGMPSSMEELKAFIKERLLRAAGGKGAASEGEG